MIRQLKPKKNVKKPPEEKERVDFEYKAGVRSDGDSNVNSTEKHNSGVRQSSFLIKRTTKSLQVIIPLIRS